MSASTTVGSIEYTLSIETANLIRGQKEAEARLEAMEKRGQQFEGRFSAIGAAISAALSGIVVSGLIQKLVQVQRQFDVMFAGLQTMTGGVDQAGAAFDRLQKFAANTPYTLDQSVNGFIKLKALGLDPSERAMTSFGNTASAMGKDLMQMIEAVADASTGEFERLKEFGIKASAQGDKVSFVFRNVKTTVANNSAAITEYLTKLGEVNFAGAMENRMKTLDGAMSNLEDSWDSLFRTVSRSGVGDAIASGVRMATTAINEAEASVKRGELTGYFDALKPVITAAEVAIVSLSGALAGKLVSSLYASTAAMVQKAIAGRAAAAAAVTETQAALALATAEQRAAAAMAAAGMGSAGLAAANAKLAAASEAAALAQRNMAAQASAAGLATRAFSGIVGALGGPIGIAITAITLLAANWDKLNGSTKSAGDITSDTAARIQKALSKTGGTPMRDLQQGLEEASAEFAKIDEQLNALGTGKQGSVSTPFEKNLLERREALRGAILDQRKAIEDLKKQQLPVEDEKAPAPLVDKDKEAEKAAKNAAYIQQLRVKATQDALAKIRIEEAGELAKVAEDARKGEITQATAEQARSLIKQQYAQQRLAISEKEAQDEAQARITMTLDEAAKIVAIREEAVRKANAAERAGTMTAAQAARERAVAQFEAGQALAQIADKQAQDRAEIAVALAKTEAERIELSRAESLRRIGVAEAKGEIDAKLAADRRVIINQDADRAIAESRERASQARSQVQTQTLQIRAEGGDTGAKEELLRQQAAAQMQATFDAQQLDLQNAQVYADARTAIEQKLQADILAMRASAAQAQLAGASSLFGSLADIAKGFAGEQSGIYKVMFAASKAFAVAESIVKIQQGIASAAALPFPANIPAMASVAAATAGIVGTIKGVNYGGGKAQGGPVAAGSMYRINEGGRPEMYTASNGAQYMMAPDRGRITSASDVQAGGSVQWQIIVNNNAPGVSVTPQIDQSARIVTLAVTEVARQVGQNSGPVWAAMRGATNITGRVA